MVRRIRGGPGRGATSHRRVALVRRARGGPEHQAFDGEEEDLEIKGPGEIAIDVPRGRRRAIDPSIMHDQDTRRQAIPTHARISVQLSTFAS